MKARRKKRAFYRKGASLAMVLVSITILTIMGTLFTAIAMRSYEYSYAKLCKQQAYYTARSGISAFYSMLKSETGLLDSMTRDLDALCFASAATYSDDDFDITTVRLEVGSAGGGTSDGLISGGFFDTFLGDCKLYVRYANKERSQISIEAHATYNGYAESARAIIARTNKASSELKKIFDNTFCLQSPITTIVTDGIDGDVYVSQPAPYLYDEDGNWIEEGVEGVYNKVLESLKKNSSYGAYTEVTAGQYIRDNNGNVVTDESTDVGKYNNVLRKIVYANVQASTEDADKIGHTKPLSMENTPITDRNSEGQTYYNDWVELYMFSAVQGDTTVDGNLYAHSRILLGLVDKDRSGRQYISYWDESLKREVYPNRASWYQVTSNLFPEYGLEGGGEGSVKDYEHGFDVDVFFDHTRTEAVLDVSVSKFRINGNMYFWDDVRIENMDSTQTENALNGVKNNIYAKQNLYIDGFHIDSWSSIMAYATMSTSKQVSVYGDVFIGENAFIRGANIYGDIYCYGEELTLVDTNVYGNIYFAGSKFTADRVTVSSGSLSVSYNGLNITQNLSGGNVVIAGTKGSSNYSTYNSKAGFGTTDDTGNNAASQWGATLIDCNIYGNLWSDVNTHIVSAKSQAGLGVTPPHPQTGYSEYGNIYATKYLYIDLIMPRSIGDGWTQTDKYPFIENWVSGVNLNYAYATENNRIVVNGMVYAERFQMKTNQSEVRNLAESQLNTVCVGRGGLYIDGCEESRLISPQKWNISISNGLYSLSSGACYNTRINGSLVDTGSFSANASESDIINRLDSSRYSIDDALESVHYSVLNSMGTTATQLDVLYETTFGSTEVWKDKVITLYSWSAPTQYDADDPDANNPERTIDYARVVEGKNERGFRDIDEYIDYLRSAESGGKAGSVDGTTLTITQSAWFSGHADFSAFDRVVIDTTKGNIHIKFGGGATFGDPTATSYDNGSDVILKGGNLTFWYLYEPEGYEIDSPTLSVNPYTQLGLIQQGTGATYSFDGLYIISNDDCLIQFANDVSLNGFVYAPYSHLLLKPGSGGTLNTLNGCMAIESLILTSDGDTLGFWDDLLAGITWTPQKIIDEVVGQYENSHYDYVMPPLIMDATFQYGDAVAELENFNEVVWEFMGYY